MSTTVNTVTYGGTPEAAIYAGRGEAFSLLKKPPVAQSVELEVHWRSIYTGCPLPAPQWEARATWGAKR